MFASRQDAGHKLGLRLQQLAVEVDIVVGLPRGGVVVAAEVADVLHRPLDVLVVRKIGHPSQREFAVGALAEEDVLILNQEVIATAPLARAELGAVIVEEEERLREYCRKFHHEGETRFDAKRVLLVDDGLATGATAEAAIYSARKKRAQKVIISTPVASTSACERLEPLADDVINLQTDPNFYAVGQYYRRFLQTTDEEVLALLHHQHADYRHAA